MSNQNGENKIILKKGDWKCPECKTHNFCSKQKCFKCRTGKSDWICPKCYFVNESQKTIGCREVKCEECGESRDLYLQSYTLTFCEQFGKDQALFDQMWKIDHKEAYKLSEEEKRYKLQGVSTFMKKLGFDYPPERVEHLTKDQTSMMNDLMTRRWIRKSSLPGMVQSVINNRDPDTGHHIGCTCDACCGIDKDY